MPATDVNGKPLAVGDMVNVECEITAIVQDTYWYTLSLTLKHAENATADTVTTIADVNAKQVVKSE